MSRRYRRGHGSRVGRSFVRYCRNSGGGRGAGHGQNDFLTYTQFVDVGYLGVQFEEKAQIILEDQFLRHAFPFEYGYQRITGLDRVGFLLGLRRDGGADFQGGGRLVGELQGLPRPEFVQIRDVGVKFLPDTLSQRFGSLAMACSDILFKVSVFNP